MTKLEGYIGVTQAAKELGVSRQTVYRLIMDKKIEALTIGNQLFLDKNLIAEVKKSSLVPGKKSWKFTI